MLKDILKLLAKLSIFSVALLLYAKAYVSFNGWQVWLAFFVISFYPFGLYVIGEKQNAKVNPSSQKTFVLWLALLTVFQMTVFSIINWFDPIETLAILKMIALYMLIAISAYLTFEKVWIGTASSE